MSYDCLVISYHCNSTVYSTVCSGKPQRRYDQSSTLLHCPFLQEIPSQKASNGESISISLHHHVIWLAKTLFVYSFLPESEPLNIP